MNNKLIIICASIVGAFLKVLCRLSIIKPSCGINNVKDRKKPVIISLTSYGRRVNQTVYCTIISLLRQSYKPDEVILWLDNENWNSENIPLSLKKLKKSGLTIKFCDDMKSYKKLIPSLLSRPDCLIITVDDDIFYRKNMVERLIRAYDNNPSMIYCHSAHGVSIDKKRGLLGYNKWEEDVAGTYGTLVFPVGEGGVLYDKNLLYNDISRADLFTTLSPMADDVWFFFMELLKGTRSCELERTSIFPYFPLDTFYQYIHKNASLGQKNVGENLNDRQIQAVMHYYGISVDCEKGEFIYPF